MDVALSAGAYRGDGRKVEVAEGRKITADPGCLVENVYLFAQKGVTWNLHGSLWRSSRLEENLSCKFAAEDSFFDNVELAKCGRSVTDIWSTRWSFQNCVFAGKFTPSEVNTKHYSIIAKRCTFYDPPLSTVKFRHSAAAEAQSKDFEFTNCRFVRCEVPESMLATTNNCVFEDCHFSDRREDWSQAGGPIAVTAYLAGKAKAPESYHNGLLTVTFKSTDAPQSGSTLTYTYENKHLAVSSIQPKGPVASLGTGESKSVSTPAPMVNSGTQAATAELVKSYRNSLVFVTGANGAGSGFLAKYATSSFLFTNAHVAAGVRGAAFKTLDGTEVKVGAASSAVGHDVFLMQATSNGLPFEIMKDVDQNAAIGDEIVVLGNAEGAGVINTITGKIVGLGPQLVEVDAPFQPAIAAALSCT